MPAADAAADDPQPPRGRPAAAPGRGGAFGSAGPVRISSVTMRAMSVIPGRDGSELTADLPDPPPAEGSVLAQGLLVGICATDGEVLSGHGRPPAGRHRLVIGRESLGRGVLWRVRAPEGGVLSAQGRPPAGRHRLVIGRESLGRVLQAPPDAPVRPGDLVVGVVRRPDPVPCAARAAGQWDFCANGQYGERGITGLDGYGATRWRVQPRFAIKVPGQLGDLGVLTEPGSIVAKAWEQIEAISARAPRPGQVALVTRSEEHTSELQS